MTPDTRSLAEKLAAHPRFLAHHPGWLPDAIPVLTDDATAGVLLGLADATGRVWRCGRGPDADYWFTFGGDRYMHTGPSLGAACAAALIAVWGEKT